MSIRTTVTLDDDVLARVTAFSRRQGIPFRRALNDLLRAGILSESGLRSAPPFQVKPRRMGVAPGVNYDCIGELLETAEGPLHR